MQLINWLLYATVCCSTAISRELLPQCLLWHLWSPPAPTSVSIKRTARLITGKRKFDHIASTMRDDLHWLPVRQRILFKLSTLVSKCLRRSAPSYLTDMCIPVSTASGRSCLRSCSRRDLRIPHYRLSWYGSRSFSVSGPTAWNLLPTAVHSDLSSSSCFCRRLKTELFSRAYGVNKHVRDSYLLLELCEHKLSATELNWFSARSPIYR